MCNLIKKYSIYICDDCVALKGKMCDHPHCVFCRSTMSEVKFILDVLLIRVEVDGIVHTQKGENV